MALVKVCFYIIGFTGLGYGALKFTQLNEENLRKELASTAEPTSDAEKKRKLMMQVLKAAADNKLPVTHQLKQASDSGVKAN